jgi:hypothetical protein
MYAILPADNSRGAHVSRPVAAGASCPRKGKRDVPVTKLSVHANRVHFVDDMSTRAAWRADTLEGGLRFDSVKRKYLDSSFTEKHADISSRRQRQTCLCQVVIADHRQW